MNARNILLKRSNTFLFLLMYNQKLLIKLLLGKLKLALARDKSDKHIKKMGEINYDLNFDFSVTNLEIKEKRLGYYELAIVDFMQQVLRPGDVFIDVGANVGYLTAIGASCVGKQGEVHAFEPIPLYATHIEKWANKNDSFKIIINHSALSDRDGSAKINVSRPPYTGNSSLVKDPKCQSIYQGEMDVPLTRLDTYISKNKIHKEKIKLIKIDVEGYEIPVLLGLKDYFENTAHRPFIICEVRGSLYSALGYQMSDLLSYLAQYGYQAYNIYAPKVKFDLNADGVGEVNVIFKC